MKYILSMLFLLFSGAAFSQQFTLPAADYQEIEKLFKESGSTADPIYLYLLLAMNSTSEKENVKRHDFSNRDICSFTQEFENDISYFTNNCSEEGGGDVQVTLPVVSRKALVNLITRLHRIVGDEIANKWNKDYTEYSPVDNGAGCYYHIVEKDNRVTIKNYCGC